MVQFIRPAAGRPTPMPAALLSPSRPGRSISSRPLKVVSTGSGWGGSSAIPARPAMDAVLPLKATRLSSKVRQSNGGSLQLSSFSQVQLSHLQMMGILGLPLVIPGGAMAEMESLSVQAGTQHNIPVEGLCIFLIAGATAYTFLFTGRFLLSCFPKLERQRKEMPWLVLTNSTDPVLEPLRKVFGANMRKLEGMDVSSIAALTFLTIFQDIAFGPYGLLLKDIPYPAVQDFAGLVMLAQREFVLPCWLLLVFRWINYI